MLIAIYSFFIGWTDAQSFRHCDEEDQDRPKTSSQTPFLADSQALFLSWHACCLLLRILVVLVTIAGIALAKIALPGLGHGSVH